MINLLTQPWMLSRAYASTFRAVAEGREPDMLYVRGQRLARDQKRRDRLAEWDEFNSDIEDVPDGRDAGRDAAPRVVTTPSGVRVAVVPVHGLLVRHASMVNGVSQPQGMSYAQVVDRVHEAMVAVGDNGVVVVDVDSPGGTLAGAEAMSAALESMQKERPGVSVVGYAADCACSGGYLVLCSCLGGVMVGQTASIGSIGVYTVVYDTSKAMEMAGVNVRLVTSGEVKGGGAEGTVVTDAHVADVQRSIDSAAAWFAGRVSSLRGVSVVAGEGVGDGRVLDGAGAVEAGLADVVVSGVDELVGRL